MPHSATLKITYDTEVSLPAGRLLLAAGSTMLDLSILNRAASSQKGMFL